MGGYRYILGTDVRFDEHGAPILATAHMFNFSDKFLKDYLQFIYNILHILRPSGRAFRFVESLLGDRLPYGDGKCYCTDKQGAVESGVD